MTARIVISSTLHHARHKPRHHRESDIIPGTASCGTILRRPHRAIAIDDGGLCAACWPAIPLAQTFDMGSENVSIAEENNDPAVALTATGSGPLTEIAESRMT